MPTLYRSFFLGLLMSIPIAGPAAQQGHSSRLTVKLAENTLDVMYGGRIRLAGGHPLFQSKVLPPSRTTAQGETFLFNTDKRPVAVSVRISDDGHIGSFFLSPNGNQAEDGSQFFGLFFDQIPEYARGVELWRYTPWNSWSKPVPVSSPQQLHPSDVQFFYWQYTDGVYGAAMPLCGKGYRSTLGSEGGLFGSKAASYFKAMDMTDIPQFAVGFDVDPFVLFDRLYEEGLTRMGKAEDLRKGKLYPPVLETLGWCSWNSSNLGRDLNEDLLIHAARSFADGQFPIGWFLVDDGWFDHTDHRLNSFEPDRTKFPRGFRPVIDSLKRTYHLKDVGVWHTLNGYWEGINQESPLGNEYRSELFTWREKIHQEQDTSAWRTCSFISPYSPSLQRFYSDFHRYLRTQGFSFIKVDNQLIVERMAVGNFPIWDGAERYHKALNSSAAATFGNAMINCMDMTVDAYFNFGTTAVARAVEDYFPYVKGETYNLQRGNAAAHVLQAAYNALYFSEVVFPDFDMFQSHNPNAVFHAIARAMNNGPIYVTDNIGEQRFDILFPLVYSDGKIIRADQSLLPTEDCLFQVQEARPFKAFSRAGSAGLLGIWNCADADSVAGTFKPSDVHGLQGESFALYEYFGKELTFAGRDDAIAVSLPRLGYRLYYVLPLIEGNAVIGLVDKYNAPATVTHAEVSAKAIAVTMHEGGHFAAVGVRSPAGVRVNGKPVAFRCVNRLIQVDIPLDGSTHGSKVDITFD